MPSTKFFSKSDILDSIKYAKRIQNTILPNAIKCKDILEDHFIFYRPKDIVSGDFYWFDEADEYLYVGLGDCTGHGVPGALVSIVCHNALQSALNEGNRKPSHILDRTRELVVEKMVDENSQLQDGMDIGLCSFHNEAGGITKAMFSGAHNPVWIIRNNEVIAVKGDKQPVGHYEHAKSFSKTNLDLMSGDVLILFSDGYPDQFGGPKGKKYSSKRLKQFFSQHQTSSLQEIKLALKSELVDWMRDEPQIDDIAIIGIKIK